MDFLANSEQQLNVTSVTIIHKKLEIETDVIKSTKLLPSDAESPQISSTHQKLESQSKLLDHSTSDAPTSTFHSSTSSV
jgi:hypothetical protein